MCSSSTSEYLTLAIRGDWTTLIFLKKVMPFLPFFFFFLRPFLSSEFRRFFFPSLQWRLFFSRRSYRPPLPVSVQAFHEGSLADVLSSSRISLSFPKDIGASPLLKPLLSEVVRSLPPRSPPTYWFLGTSPRVPKKTLLLTDQP